MRRSAYWWYSIHFEGKRYRKSTNQTKKSAAAAVEAAMLAQLQERGTSVLRTTRPPILRDFSVRFLEWVKKSQRLTPNSKRYYRYGWRLLSYSDLAGMRLNEITQDVAESIVFIRPLLDRKKKKKGQANDETAEIESQEKPKKMIPCSNQYSNQALRTLKRMQGKAMEWKVLRERPKITLAETAGRDRLIDERTEDKLCRAYATPIKHRRTRRLRQQAWLFMVILQDCGMRPDEVFPMRIENIHWEQDRIWIPEGKTEKSRRFVPMSARVKGMLRQWRGERETGWVFPSDRSRCGHLTTIAKGFQAARARAELDSKVVPYSARHTYGTYTMEATGNVFAIAKSMGHVDVKSMEPYQHQELDSLRVAIDQRNRQRASGWVAVPAVPGVEIPSSQFRQTFRQTDPNATEGGIRS
jgi:integrase